jgi:membrane protein
MAEKSGARLRKLYTTAYEFVTEKDIGSDGSATTSKVERFAHFWLLAIKSFLRNKGPLRATALAYATLFSLVPLLAIAVSITTAVLAQKGEDRTKQYLKKMVDYVAPQLQLLRKTDGSKSSVAKDPKVRPEDKQPDVQDKTTAPQAKPQSALQPETDVREEVVDKIYGFIQNVKPGTLTITGMVGLIAVAILLLTNIENTFNDIWGITQGRSWFKRVVQYWATISLGPIVLSLIVYLAGKSMQATELAGVPQIATKVLTFFVVSCAFALFYKLMPNTEVHWNAAAVGGFVGGSLWLLLNIANALNMSKVVNMSAIYGSSMAVLPIFLLGLYFSWLILLFGAQVSYAYQNRQVYLQEKQAESVSQKAREYVALRIMTLLAQRFERGLKPPTLLEIGTELGVSTRLAGRIVQPLIDTQLAAEVRGKEACYAPARPIETITCEDILEVFRIRNGRDLETKDEPTRPIVCAEFERIRAAEKQAAQLTTLKDLVSKLPIAVAEVEPDSVGTGFWRKKAS